jgi:uracil-DNA glycosylase family 4
MSRPQAIDEIFSDRLRIDRETRTHLNTLAKRIENSDCQGCSLAEGRGKKPVAGEGQGRVMFVGHTIGRAEANMNKPAAGEASQYGFKLFTDILPTQASFSPQQARQAVLRWAYVTNAARCGPQKDASTANWTRCAGPRGPNWLQMEMGLVDPEIVVFWKKGVAKALINDVPTRGTIEYRSVYGTQRPVMLMTHPVKVAYNPEEETTVKGDYRKLAQWLSDEDLLESPPDAAEYPDATHHLVTTPEGLGDMIEDVKNKTQVGLDSETFSEGGREQMQGHLDGSHQSKKGALLWHQPEFETVCYQICGLNDQGWVDDTWTVAMRFRDRLTGEPFQDIAPEDALGALDEVLAHKPQGQVREIYMWNALFDCPVFTREGIDLWGLTHQEYPAVIRDGMVYMSRLNEYLGKKRGRSTLDNAASIHLQERKGSFDEHFSPDTFAYNDLRDSEVREQVVHYCGEDPRKTLLVSLSLLEDLDEHLDERVENLNPEPSSLPIMGFQPYDRPSEEYTGARLEDVAIPMAFQMIPLIGEMEMIGFRFEESEVEEAKRAFQETKDQLMEGIHQDRPNFNPNSSQDALDLIHKVFNEYTEELNRLINKYPNRKKDIVESFQISARNLGGGVTANDLSAAFAAGYGELNAQKGTIKNKVLIYLNVSMDLLREELPDEEELGLSYLARPDNLEMFFQRVFLWKQLHKREGTYFDRFSKISDDFDIFHPSFGYTSTLSHRFSGNFQNVPRGGPEDREFVKKIIKATGQEIPEDEDEREQLIGEYNKFDVRQHCEALQPKDLNRIFTTMDLGWEVREEPYCIVTADYAGQEDRMAYAESGDETKARLLSNPDIDTHFYNVAFCFGSMEGFDTSTQEGIDRAYEHFTKQQEIADLEEQIEQLLEVNASDEEIQEVRGEINRLKKIRKENKRKYRTPMKTVHYASQYGAGADKIHSVLKPVMQKVGMDWSPYQTQELKEKYDELYRGVTEAREEILSALGDTRDWLEYPVWGALRHANVTYDGEVLDGLSVANAYNQGTCAYMTMTGMLRMRHLIYLNADRWNLVHSGGDRYVGVNLQVHDEIACLAPISLAREVALALESAMKMVSIPLKEAKEHGPYWTEDFADYRGETGWLGLPDQQFDGACLFDADAEVKRTVAKAKTLSDGTKNTIAKLEEPETFRALEEKHPPSVNKDAGLTLAKKNHTEYIL